MEELISVIIPVYKVEKYINKCIDSIINQTYKNLEIILIDDGSPDNCAKICDEYAKLDERIKVIHKKNGGQSEARNIGLDIAQGKYIGFVDSDDYIKNDMFEVLYRNLIEFNADISITNIIEIKKRQEVIEKYNDIEIYDKTNIIPMLLNNHITNYLYNKLYKKELWKDIRLPVGRILEDMDVMYRILERADRVVCTNRSAYYYLIREDSSISKINIKLTNDLKEAVNKRYEYLKERRPELLDILIPLRLYNIMQYHDNLAICKEYNIYNNEEYDKEYFFYKEHFKKYKKELYREKNIRKKLEMYLLYRNKTIFYYYCIIKNKIKNK